MEDNNTSFFINGLKVHIESSINKYEEKQTIIFDKDFENLFLTPIYINNINLFREIITQNNLNFQVFWNHIGKIMKSSIESLIQKFEEEINKQKDMMNEQNKLDINIANKNILKLKILNICFYFITNEDSDTFQLIKGEDKDMFKNLLELYIKKEIENNNDYSLFIKNYLIKITLLINDNCRGIHLGFLKYLSFTIYNFESFFVNKEQINNLKIYIDQAINNPRRELNNYLNGAFNKKNYKKEKLSRSRGASFDIKDANTNNNTIEKNNKKIEDFFKISKKEKEDLKRKNNSVYNSGGTKATENNQNNILNQNREENENEIEIKNNKNKNNLSNSQGKILHFSSHASNISLFNFNSGTNYSNSLLLNNSFSFSKNNNINNSKISLDDSFSLTGIFSTPISELNDNDDTKKFNSKFHFPSIVKCVHNKKKKPFDRLKDKIFGEQMNIKKYMKVENIKKENEEEIKELRNVVNSSFYGNKIDCKKKINNIKENNDKNKVNNDKKNKDGNILIYKTPNKNDKENINENINENIKENIDIKGIKKNWELLFAQKTNI